MLDKAADFLKSCNPEETIVVYHKGCGDGIAASAILGRFFKKTKGAGPKKFIAISYDEDFAMFVKKILAQNIKNVIFADLSLDKFPGLLMELAKKFRILILDHHTLVNDMNKHGILHIHPDFISKIQSAKYCGAKITYDICSKAENMSDVNWLAAVGIIHDIGSAEWKDFLDEVYAKYPELKSGYDVYGFDSKLGELTSLISASKVGVAKEIRTINLCINTENPIDILEMRSDLAKELKYWKEKMDKEINNYVQNWKTLGRIYNDLKFAIVEIKTKLPISSTVSTILSLKNPDYIFCIYKLKGRVVDISFRAQGNRINCAKLAQESTKGFEFGSGGGHPPAAGARVLKKDFERFKRQLPAIVKRLLK